MGGFPLSLHSHKTLSKKESLGWTNSTSRSLSNHSVMFWVVIVSTAPVYILTRRSTLETLWIIPQSLTHYSDTIAAGLFHGDIIVLNGSTGSQVAVLSKHTKWVESLVFLSDGILLVSGSSDITVNLWDVTGIRKSGDGFKVFCLGRRFY